MKPIAFALALLAPFTIGAALANPPEACWPQASLAGNPAEIPSHRAGAADQVVMPIASAPLVDMAASPGDGVIRRVKLPAGQKLVALTFDLCEARGEVAGYDGGVVDTLRAANAPATFFMGGRWAESHEQRAMQLLADPLFEVGNHTYDHANLDHADAAKVSDEIEKTETVLRDLRARIAKTCPAAGPLRASGLFRFPYGSCSPESLAATTSLGQTPIQWDVVSGDPSGIGGAPMSKAVLAEVKPGSIIVMHANGRGKHSAEALKTIIPKLRAQGYRFVTVSELIAAGTPQRASACFIERPGDTARYDRTAPAKTELPAKGPVKQGAGGAPAPTSG